jgi:hypothetical protein
MKVDTVAAPVQTMEKGLSSSQTKQFDRLRRVDRLRRADTLSAVDSPCGRHRYLMASTRSKATAAVS